LLAIVLSARCNWHLECARQLAAVISFPLATQLVLDTVRISSGILPWHDQRALRAASNRQGASISERSAMWWIMVSTWPQVACMNNRRLNGALWSRLAGALENRMKKPEIELRLCARRYMSHCPEG
jgi:hypothetical protein